MVAPREHFSFLPVEYLEEICKVYCHFAASFGGRGAVDDDTTEAAAKFVAGRIKIAYLERALATPMEEIKKDLFFALRGRHVLVREATCGRR